MSKGILYDATACIGCKQCEQACATENGLPYDDKIAGEEVTSARKYTTVLVKDDKFMRRLCMHCETGSPFSGEPQQFPSPSCGRPRPIDLRQHSYYFRPR